MARFSFASLHTRLIFLILLAVFPALGLTLYAGLEQRRETVRHVQHDALVLARHAAAIQGNLIDNARQVLFALSHLFLVHEQDPALYSAIFANFLKQSESYSNLLAAKHDGSVFASALPVTLPMNLADRPYFQRVLQTRDFTIGEYQIGRVSGKAAIVFAYPILDDKGDLQVVLAIGVDLEWLNQFIARSGHPAGATCTVIDRTGVILARYPDSQEFVGKAMPEAPITKAMLAQGEGTAEGVGLDGVERLYGFAPLEYASNSVFVRVGIPKQVAFADANRKLARNLGLLGIVALLALSAAWFGGNIFILRRLNGLLDAARSVADGNLRTRLGPPYVRGELGQLAMTFDKMAAAIQTRETKTQQRSSEIAGLLESASAVLEYRNFKDSARRIFDSCKSVIGATAGYVALLSEDGTENKVLLLDSGGDRCTVDPNLPMPIRGLREEAYRSGKAVYCNDFSQSQWVKLMPQGHADLENVLFAPLVIKGKVVGLVGLANKPGGFTEDDACMAAAFGELAAIALFNSQTWESLQDSKERLEQHRQHLEKLVEERTAELTASNQQLLLEIDEREQVEKELLVERQKLQGILDSMNDGVCVINRQYNVEYVNPVIENEFGSVGGRKCYEYFHGGAVVCPECRIQEVLAGKSFQWEWSSGTAGKIYELHDTPIRNVDGSISKLEIFRDITGRKMGEDALRRNEELLRNVLDTLPVGVWIQDDKGQIVHGNPAGTQIWAGAKFVGIEQFGEYKGWWLDTGKQIEPEEWAAARAIMKGETSLNEEIKIECFDGTNKIILNSAIPIRNAHQEITGAIIVNQDITERVHKERERALLATAVEQAAEGVLVTTADWTIQHMNPAFEHTTGYTLEETVGRHHRIFKSGKHDRAFYKAMRNTLDLGGAWRGRLISKRKDGAFFDAEAVISPVRDINGNITHWVTIARDITHEVNLEAQLRQAQKVEALGTLAGGIAHDFNNILGIIIGYVQLAQFIIPKGDEAQSHLGQVFRATNRAKGLVRQILAFSRQVEQELQPTRIGLIVNEALEMLRASLPASIEIRQNIASKGLVWSDPTQIHQVLLNLCTNAAHAMGEKSGVLEVSLLDADLDADVTARYPDVHPGPYLRLTVSDTGHGMNPEIKGRIFDPYFTTKAPGEGTGLGLSVVHGIVRSHGGIIAVDSEPGKGSTFQVFFPKFQNQTNGLMLPSTSLDSIPVGTECILFVDDEEGLCKSWQKTLEGLGYKVTARKSGIEALEAFRTWPDKFDLVITDLTMPKMTGIDFARELLSIRPDIPVILCTGFSHTVTLENAKAVGVRELLMKPLIAHELAGAIRRVLDA